MNTTKSLSLRETADTTKRVSAPPAETLIFNVFSEAVQG